MNKKGLIILALILAPNTLFAIDITPGGNLAKVKLVLPIIPENLQQVNYEIYFKTKKAPNYVEVKSGEINYFHNGQACLKIKATTQASKMYRFESCEFNLVAKKLHTINLGGFYFSFDYETVSVDVGPEPIVRLAATKSIKAPEFHLNKSAVKNKAFLHVVPEGEYQYYYRNNTILSDLPRNSITIEAGKIADINVNPPEMRATIILKGDEKAKYPRPLPSNNELFSNNDLFSYKLVIFRSKELSAASPAHPQDKQWTNKKMRANHKSPNSYNGYVGSWLRFKDDELVSTAVVYPMSKENSNGNYELVISGMRKKNLALEANSKLEIGFTTVNIGKVDGVHNGFFKLFHNYEEEKYKQLQISGININGSPVFRDTYIKTEHSVDLLNNEKYRLDAFLKDETDTIEQQESTDFEL